MTGRPQPRLYPAGPLLDAWRLSQHRLAVAVHANGTDICDAIRDGLTAAQADRWACRLHFHPAEIWADWYQMEETA